MGNLLELRTAPRRRPDGREARADAAEAAEIIVFPRMSLDHLRRIWDALQEDAASPRDPSERRPPA